MSPRTAARLKFILPATIIAGLIYLLAPQGEATDFRPPEQRRAFNASFPALDGPEWNAAGDRGKVVLLNFWATWCPPCREETPALVRIANAYRNEGVSVVGVNMDENAPRTVREFVKTYRISYPVLVPPPNSPITDAIEALPTTLLIDKQGRVAKAYHGAESERTFRRDIEALLREPAR